MKGRIEKFLSMRSRRLEVRNYFEKYVAALGYQHEACGTYRLFEGQPEDTVAEAIESALDARDTHYARMEQARKAFEAERHAKLDAAVSKLSRWKKPGEKMGTESIWG
jgi:hypothetical protein